jgi:hypothetical protein
MSVQMDNTNIEHVTTSILIYMYEYQEQNNITDKSVRNVYMLKTMITALFPEIGEHIKIIVQYCDNPLLNRTIVQLFLKIGDNICDPSYETFKERKDNVYLDQLNDSFIPIQRTQLITEYVNLTKYIEAVENNRTVYDDQIYDDYMNKQLIYVLDKLRVVNGQLYTRILESMSITSESN